MASRRTAVTAVTLAASMVRSTRLLRAAALVETTPAATVRPLATSIATSTAKRIQVSGTAAVAGLSNMVASTPAETPTPHE